MAEQSKSEIHEKIQQLNEECEKLEELGDQLNQDQVEIRKKDEEERAQFDEEHQTKKKVFDQKIFELKDELDTVLSNPNFMA